ncbi:hypothetical protein D3C80_1242570 [compost metagenome]
MAIAERIDDLEQRITDPNLGTQWLQIADHPGVFGIGVLRTGKRRGLAAVAWRIRPNTADQTLVGEVSQNLLGAGLARFAFGVGHAAQFNGGGDAGQRDLGFGEAVGQFHPGHRAGFIEGIAAGVFGQQRCLGTQARRQRAQARPVLRQGVKQHHRFEIAMQVEHQVRVARLLQEQAAQAVEFRLRRWQRGEDV